MSKKEILTMIEKMSVEEKLKLLSETDKAYIRGYIDRAVAELKSVNLHSVDQKQRAKNSKGTN